MGRRSNYQKRRLPGAQKARNMIVQETGTLLPFLFQAFSQQSKSSVKSLLKYRQVSVNGKVTTQFDTPVNKGDQVSISYERGKVEFSHPLLRMVWEDDSLIIVDKKEGLLAAGNAKIKERTAFILLAEYLKKQDPRNRLFLLNPLDRETSGLMVFARNRGVQQLFLNDWNERITLRSFMVVVEGRPEKDTGILTSSRDDSDERVIVTSMGDSRQTVLRYRVIKSNDSYSLLEVIQEAGKKNIIKEQMAAMGTPVVGDIREEAEDPLQRLAIHANKLCLKHPDTGENMCFQSHYPPSFNAIVK